jgi:hypothetical protein
MAIPLLLQNRKLQVLALIRTRHTIIISRMVRRNVVIIVAATAEGADHIMDQPGNDLSMGADHQMNLGPGRIGKAVAKPLLVGMSG